MVPCASLRFHSHGLRNAEVGNATFKKFGEDLPERERNF